MAIADGEQATVALYGYRDGSARNFDVSIDGGSAVAVGNAGSQQASAMLWTSPALASGSHTMTVELDPSATAGVTLDYYEVVSGAKASAPSVASPASAPARSPSPAATPLTAALSPAAPVSLPPASSPPTPTGGDCAINPGDGQTAITAAIGSCPDGSTVNFPSGHTYHIDGQIVVRSRQDLTIDGHDSSFVSSATNDPSKLNPDWALVEDNNLTLRNMTVRGNLTPGSRGLLPGNQFNAGVVVFGGAGITITDISVYSVFGEFVVLDPSGIYDHRGALSGQVPTNVTINHLIAAHAARQCVAATAVQGFWLRDSSLSDCYQNGVDLEPDVAGEPVQDVHVLHNTISGFHFSAFVVPTTYAAGDVGGIELRNNQTLTASDTCWPAVQVGGVQHNVNQIADVVTADNTLLSQGNGIVYQHASSGSITGNSLTITHTPGWCGSDGTPSVGTRLIDSAATVTGNNTSGY